MSSESGRAIAMAIQKGYAERFVTHLRGALPGWGVEASGGGGLFVAVRSPDGALRGTANTVKRIYKLHGPDVRDDDVRTVIGGRDWPERFADAMARALKATVPGGVYKAALAALRAVRHAPNLPEVERLAGLTRAVQAGDAEAAKEYAAIEAALARNPYWVVWRAAVALESCGGGGASSMAHPVERARAAYFSEGMPGALRVLREAFPSREDGALLRAAGIPACLPLSDAEPIRASGDTVCGGCGRAYRLHLDDPEIGWSGGGDERPFLKRICDGTRVKL